jgi:hypothetical protein
VKGEAAALLVPAQNYQSYYFSTTPRTTQNNTGSFNHKHTKQHKKGNLHFLFPTRTQNHQPVQTYKHQNQLQMPQHKAQLTKPATDRKIPTHNKGVIYQLTSKSCNISYIGQTVRSLKICFQEHLRYIRSNNPQSAYAQQKLHNQHEYGTMNELMTLLKPLKYKNMLIPYEQFYIQSLHQAGKLIPEQYPGELNPLFQLAIPPSLHTTRQSHSSNIMQPGHITYSSAPDQQPANQRYVRLIVWSRYHSTYQPATCPQIHAC